MKDQFIALLKKLGLWVDAKADEITKALDELKIEEPTPTQPANIDTSKITDPVVKQMFDTLNGQLVIVTKQNKDLLDTLAQERQQRESAIKVQQEQAKKDLEKRVTELVGSALKEGKIPKAKEEWLKKFAEKDIDGASEWVKEAPVDKHLAAEQGKDGKTKDGKNPEKKDDEPSIKSPLAGANSTILSKVQEFAGIQDN